MSAEASPEAAPTAIRSVRRIIPIAACGLLAIGIGVTGLSDLALQAGNPGLALALWPGSADAAAGRANQLYEQGQPDGARSLALKALRESPMNSTALRVIVRTAQEQRDDALAEAGLVLAARSGWRDGLAQLWLLNRAMAQQDYVTAAQAADALLRIRYADTEARAAVATLLHTAGGRAALAERMSDRPPWAPMILRNLRSDTAEQVDDGAAFLIALDQQDVHPGEKDIRPFLEASLSHGYGTAMQKLWRTLDSRMIADPDGGLNDGGFTQLAADPDKWRPFGWNIASTPSVTIETPSRTEFQIDPVVRIEAEGTQSTPAISQSLTLVPGTYVLSYDSKFETGLHGAFYWQVQCTSRSARLLYSVAIPDTAGRDWIENRLQFRVPDHCPAQQIALLVRPSPAGTSAASFDSIKIGRASAL